jgi:ribosomal protein L24
MPDKEVRGMTVYISRGDLKGYRGKVVRANETEAQVQVFAKGNMVVTLSREEICPVFDDTAPMRLEANAPIMISFDQAMNQEYVNIQPTEEGQATSYHPDVSLALNKGGGTPVWKSGAETVDQQMDRA